MPSCLHVRGVKWFPVCVHIVVCSCCMTSDAMQGMEIGGVVVECGVVGECGGGDLVIACVLM